jgi:DNA-binding CsgD family transcriptional regulator/tetratricopeptide (TPR) repeat protein
MAAIWPLTARGALFERLGRMYADLSAGGVVLTGPAGVGKTRLGEELLGAAGDRPIARVVGHPATQPIPLGAMAHLIPAEITNDVGVGDDERAALFHRARRCLADKAGDRRVLFVADDVDQLDETSLALLLPLTIDRQIFLVATIRAGRPLPKVIATLLKDDHLVLEAVPTLTRDEVTTLLHRVLDGPAETSAVERFASASEGNLQILRELVHRSIEHGALRLDGGVWCLDDLPMSSTLEELIVTQLADLDADAARVTDVLAVAGTIGLSDIEEIAHSAVLLRLEERGLIRVTFDERRTFVSLSHPMYGEVIRSRLHVLKERELQRELADRLEAHGARRRGDVMHIARWRLEAGGEVSANVLLDAGRLALIGRDANLAERFAVAASDRGLAHDASLVRVEAAALRADVDGLERVVTEVWHDPLLPDGHRSHLVRRLAHARFFQGDLAGALSALEDADERLTDPRSIAAARAERAVLLANNGRPHDALRIIEEAGDVADPRLRIEFATAHSIASLSVGRFAEAIDLSRRAAREHAGLPEWLSRRGAAAHVINEGHALGYSGRFGEARVLVRDALSRARAAGAEAAIVWFEIVLGEIERDSGHGHAAIEHFSVATSVATSAGHNAALVWAWVGVAQGNLLLGNDEAAASALARADACTSPVATSWSTRERTRAWLEACRGDLGAARALITEVAERSRADGLLNFEVGVVHDLVRFGDPGAALGRLEELAEVVEGPYAHALVVHARAAVGQDLGLYQLAVDEFEAMECLVWAAEAATACAELHRRSGDQRAAAAMGQRALHFVETAGGARTPGLLRGSGVEPLTTREREVALLAASGVSSKDIAGRLIVSKRTIDSHLDRVYRKLGVTGREQLSGALASTEPITSQDSPLR